MTQEFQAHRSPAHAPVRVCVHLMARRSETTSAGASPRQRVTHRETPATPIGVYRLRRHEGLIDGAKALIPTLTCDIRNNPTP